MIHPLRRIQVSGIEPEGLRVQGEISPVELELESYDRIDFPNPVIYRFELSTVSDGLLVRGEVSTVCRCRCDRCLKYFNRRIDLAELCYFFREISDDTVDLTDPVRQDILLTFPQRLLCREECAGLCELCGVNLNVRSCDCRRELETGSVWDKLNELNLPPSPDDESGEDSLKKQNGENQNGSATK